MRLLRRLVLPLGLSSGLLPAGCAHLTPAEKAEQAKAQAVVQEVERVRGLSEREPLRMRFHSLREFQQLLRKRVDEELEEHPEDLAEERARWTAFGLAPAGLDPGAVARSVLGEQVAAYYDQKERTLHVPREGTAAVQAAGAEGQTMVLAHEIEHALQDQHFGMPDLTKLDDDDVRIARQAALEGEATLTMLVVAASRQGPIDPQRIAAASEQLAQLPVQTLLEMSGHSPDLQAAPPVVQEELVFPYFGGLQLFARLFATGGFPLVNEALAHPPDSSEQVLHPEKYAAGDEPRDITPPALGKDEKERARGTLGELGIRTLLSDCIGPKGARLAAGGWGGDRYVVGERPDGTLTLRWTVAFDDAAEAAEFAAHRSELATCWQETAGSGKGHVGAAIGERLQGDTVAITRGIPPEMQDAELTALFALPRPPKPPRPPLSVTTLAPLPPPKSAAQGPAHPPPVVEHGQWTSSWAGLTAPVPEGFTARLDQAGAELVLQRDEAPRAVALLAVVPAADSPQTRRAVVGGVVGQIGAALGRRGKPVLQDTAPAQIAGQAGEVSRYVIEGTGSRSNVVLWPACGGRALYLLSLSGEDESALARLTEWSGQLQTAPGAPQACGTPPPPSAP